MIRLKYRLINRNKNPQFLYGMGLQVKICLETLFMLNLMYINKACRMVDLLNLGFNDLRDILTALYKLLNTGFEYKLRIGDVPQ